MSANSNCLAVNGERKNHAITLWNLHDHLSRLATDLAEAAKMFDKASADTGRGPPAIEAMAPRAFFTSLLELRRMRERHFGTELFGEPAWDVMLQLMIARIDGTEFKLSELTGNSASPPIASRQYVEELIQARLVDRFENADNEPDFYLSLSSEAARRMAELYRARICG